MVTLVRPRVSIRNELNWSEQIVVIGRGVEQWSRKYGTLTHCIAGIGASGKWIRLFPLPQTKIELFDVIQAAIVDEQPESFRPESRKVHFRNPIKKVSQIKATRDKLKILQDHLDSGDFLHDDSWNGKKTLGLIQPVYPEFKVDRNRKKIIAKYKCDAQGCLGHLQEVFGIYNVDRVGRRRLCAKLDEIKSKIVQLYRERLLDRNILWFVMGTVKFHPSRWIIVEILVEKDGSIESLRTLLRGK